MLPAEVIKTVDDQRRAWTSSYAVNRARYRSSTEAMNAIASYLSICLPENIEASIRNTLQVARYAITAPNGKIEPVAVSSTPYPEPITFLSGNARQAPLPKFARVPPEEPATNSLNPFEANLSPAEVKIVQRRLCVIPVDGDLGGANSNTRMRIKTFKALVAGRFETSRYDGLLGDTTYTRLRGLDDCGRSTLEEHFLWRNETQIRTFNQRLLDALAFIKEQVTSSPDPSLSS